MKPATVAVGGKVLAQLRLGSTLSAGRVPRKGDIIGIFYGEIMGISCGSGYPTCFGEMEGRPLRPHFNGESDCQYQWIFGVT
jgi:hypothetical protein